MTSTQLNIFTWNSKRELRYSPAHFVVVHKLITRESLHWILEKQTGRFSLVESPYYGFNRDNTINPEAQDYFGYYPAFETPAEAIHFQLIWM